MKWFAVLCALSVAVCWGLYGPTLSNARSPNREWGPFKPYLFIGMAYLLIAIIGGSIMMKFVFNDNFDYTGKFAPAMTWGFLAGCLGAVGCAWVDVRTDQSRWETCLCDADRLWRRGNGQRHCRLLQPAPG